MKSLETLLSEEKTKFFASEKSKGFNEAASETQWRERVMVDGTSLEQKLSAAKKLTANIQESTPINESRRVNRNNGGRQDFTENTVSRDERILHFMKESALSYREACYMIGEKPERDATMPTSIIESIIKAWKKFLPSISERDARTLAERGVQP